MLSLVAIASLPSLMIIARDVGRMRSNLIEKTERAVRDCTFVALSCVSGYLKCTIAQMQESLPPEGGSEIERDISQIKAALFAMSTVRFTLVFLEEGRMRRNLPQNQVAQMIDGIGAFVYLTSVPANVASSLIDWAFADSKFLSDPHGIVDGAGVVGLLAGRIFSSVATPLDFLRRAIRNRIPGHRTAVGA